MKPKSEDSRFALLKGRVSEGTGQDEVHTRRYTQEVDTLSLLHHFTVCVKFMLYGRSSEINKTQFESFVYLATFVDS